MKLKTCCNICVFYSRCKLKCWLMDREISFLPFGWKNMTYVNGYWHTKKTITKSITTFDPPEVENDGTTCGILEQMGVLPPKEKTNDSKN